MNPSITTREQISHDINRQTPEVLEYVGEVTITAQAAHDRWPEAVGMRRRLRALARKAGISPEQMAFDLTMAPITCDGGRW